MPLENQTGGVKYLCPVCHAEIEMPAQGPDQTNQCPSCGEVVHFRRKLYLKPAVAGVSVFPERTRRRQVIVLAILVIFSGFVVMAFFKLKNLLQ